MPGLRKLVLACCIALYAVACPLLLLYTLGYVVAPGGEGMEKTGVISIATVPSGATVYLEHRRYTKRTPVVLSGLLPGSYQVGVVLQGHRPWQRTVSVEANQATVLEHLLLLSTAPRRQVALSGVFEELIPVPDTPLMLLASAPDLEEFMVYDAEAKAAWPLVPAAMLRGHASEPVLRTTPGSPLVICRLRQDGREQTWGILLQHGESRILDASNLIPARAREVCWSGRLLRRVFALEQGIVNRVDLEAQAIYPRIAQRVRGLGMTEQWLYLLSDDGAIQRMDHDGKPTDSLIDDPAFANACREVRGAIAIEAVSEEELLLLGEHGELLTNRAPYQLVERGVRGISIDAKRRHALVWQKERVGVAVFDHADAVVQWLPFAGRAIEHAWWVYQGTHALVLDRDEVFLVDVTLPDAAPQPLLHVTPKSGAVYLENTGLLYYLDPSTGALCSVDVLPRWEFPRGFLGRE